MYLHLTTRVLALVVCIYICIVAVSSVPIFGANADFSDDFTRGTVFFPNRPRRNDELEKRVNTDYSDYYTRGTMYFPTRQRRNDELDKRGNNDYSDYFTRGTVYFPTRQTRNDELEKRGNYDLSDYFTRGTVYFPQRQRRGYVPIDPGMADHMCIIKPNFYCMCTSNGYVSFCENNTSSYF